MPLKRIYKSIYQNMKALFQKLKLSLLLILLVLLGCDDKQDWFNEEINDKASEFDFCRDGMYHQNNPYYTLGNAYPIHIKEGSIDTVNIGLLNNGLRYQGAFFDSIYNFNNLEKQDNDIPLTVISDKVNFNIESYNLIEKYHEFSIYTDGSEIELGRANVSIIYDDGYNKSQELNYQIEFIENKKPYGYISEFEPRKTSNDSVSVFVCIRFWDEDWNYGGIIDSIQYYIDGQYVAGSNRERVPYQYIDYESNRTHTDCDLRTKPVHYKENHSYLFQAKVFDNSGDYTIIDSTFSL